MNHSNERIHRLHYVKKTGIAFFVIGIIVAITLGARLPEGDNTFPDTLPIFAVAALIAVSGQIMWRLSHRAIISHEINLRTNDTSGGIRALISGTVDAIANLDNRRSNLGNQKLCDEVDIIFDQWIHPLVEIRSHITDELGMGEGAEVLVTFAYGERLLNRVWSAAADGYRREAGQCFSRGPGGFRKSAGSAGKYTCFSLRLVKISGGNAAIERCDQL